MFWTRKRFTIQFTVQNIQMKGPSMDIQFTFLPSFTSFWIPILHAGEWEIELGINNYCVSGRRCRAKDLETHFPGARTCIECETWEMACLLGLFSFPKTNRNPRDGWIPEIHFHFPFEFQVLTSLDMARELISFSNFGHDRDVPVSSRQRLRQQPSGLILDPQLMAVDNLLTSRWNHRMIVQAVEP